MAPALTQVSCRCQLHPLTPPPSLPPSLLTSFCRAQRKFCFESESWARCIHESCFLSKVFRQVSAELAQQAQRSRAPPTSCLRTLAGPLSLLPLAHVPSYL